MCSSDLSSSSSSSSTGGRNGAARGQPSPIANPKQGGAAMSEYDVVQLEDGGYKRRRIGAKGAWQVS